MRSSGEQGGDLSMNASAEGTQYYTGDPGVFAGASYICASHSDNGPSLVASSGPLTRDRRQSPDYGFVNCSGGHGTGGNPLARENHLLHGPVLPAVAATIMGRDKLKGTPGGFDKV